jgi:RND family efflux transporter MFP subunit
MNYRRTMLALAVALAVVAGCRDEESSGKPGGPRGGPMNVTKAVTVQGVAVQSGPFAVQGDYGGEFVSDAMADLSSDVTGRVREVKFQLGDKVKKGDTLATIDPVNYQSRVRELQASVELAKASMAEAEATVDNLEAELRRKEPLLARKLVTEREIEDLKARIVAARQRIGVARATSNQNQARLDAARNDLSDTRVKAPFDGVVAERFVDVGTYVSPTQPLFRVVDKGAVYLRIRIPEADSGLVTEGMPVSLRVDALGGKKLEGEVGRVAPALDPATRTLRVDVMPTDEAAWDRVRPGMFSRAQLQLGSRDAAITVVNQAIMKERDGSRFVWRVVDDVASKVRVELGLRGRVATEVTTGLSPGDVVVLRGHEKLRTDDTPVVLLERRADEPAEAGETTGDTTGE